MYCASLTVTVIRQNKEQRTSVHAPNDLTHSQLGSFGSFCEAELINLL